MGNKLDRFDLYDIIDPLKGVVNRKSCIRIFKKKKMRVSVSKYMERMGSRLGYMNLSDLTDKSDRIITELRREWEINEILDK